MRAERDFDAIKPVFFQHLAGGRRGAGRGRARTLLQDAKTSRRSPPATSSSPARA